MRANKASLFYQFAIESQPPSLAFNRVSKAGRGAGKLQVCPNQRLLPWRNSRWAERKGLAAVMESGRPLRRLLQKFRDAGDSNRMVVAELVSCHSIWICFENRASRNSWYVACRV